MPFASMRQAAESLVHPCIRARLTVDWLKVLEVRDLMDQCLEGLNDLLAEDFEAMLENVVDKNGQQLRQHVTKALPSGQLR